jgi:uncharacterized protein (DUF885 family)
VANEIDRYIGWPGHALPYMTGCREIQRLRALAERQLGPRFDIRAFHGTVPSVRAEGWPSPRESCLIFM